jgi:hypothetical protein
METASVGARFREANSVIPAAEIHCVKRRDPPRPLLHAYGECVFGPPGREWIAEEHERHHHPTNSSMPPVLRGKPDLASSELGERTVVFETGDTAGAWWGNNMDLFGKAPRADSLPNPAVKHFFREK